MDEESNTYSNKYSKIHIQRECMFFLFLRKTKYKLFKKNDENTNYAQKKKTIQVQMWMENQYGILN